MRIGIDTGGTFTDFVLHDPRRDLVHTGKLLTTPDDPSEVIIVGIERLLREKGLQASELHSIVHGTTLVTNTVIERTGATVGLITTAGFRDVIEVGRETRYDLYDLFLEAPPTLVPRHRRALRSAEHLVAEVPPVEELQELLVDLRRAGRGDVADAAGEVLADPGDLDQARETTDRQAALCLTCFGTGRPLT